MKRKTKDFNKAFNFIQKRIMAEMLLNNEIERVKYIFYSYKVEFTDELAEEIKVRYGQKQNNDINRKEQ